MCRPGFTRTTLLPTTRLSKSVIDALQPAPKDIVYWDETLPGFGVKVTPKGRKVFAALYRTGGGGSQLRKYTIGPYGRVTLHGTRAEAQKVVAATPEGRDPAAEKREGKRRLTIDRIEDVVTLYDQKHLAAKRSRREIKQILDRVAVSAWRGRTVHEIKRRDVLDIIQELESRGTPYAANKLTKVLRAFFRWCVGRAILERSPMDGIALPFDEISRERTLSDGELASVIKASRDIGGPFGAIVEMLALTGQRREEVARMTWAELDLDARTWTLEGARTKNGRAHIVYLSEPALHVLNRCPRLGPFVFTSSGTKRF